MTEDLTSKPKKSLWDQIVKFALVGGLSMAIDSIILFALYKSNLGLGLGRWLTSNGLSLYRLQTDASGSNEAAWREASIPFIQVLSGIVATLSSFYFNRGWTFGIKSAEGRVSQFWRYLAIYGTSILLHSVMVAVLAHGMSLVMAKIITIGIMTVYNFVGVKLWAFRGATADSPAS